MSPVQAMTKDPDTLPVEAIIFREDLYPRLETSATTVQKYAEDLTVLPPIEVNQKNELIDGWHRWTAHKKANAKTIAVVITPTKSDADLLELAIARNATAGLQLSQTDKKDMARRIYTATPLSEQGPKKHRLAQILSVSIDTVQNWLARIDKDNQELRDAQVFQMWLACYTQEEIAAAVGMSHQGVARVLQQIRTFGFVAKPGECDDVPEEERDAERIRRHRAAAEHETDFAPPLYNIWKQQEKTAGSGHFGNSEVRWVDNLLYLYTKPFDVVIDPFAGGGSTIDLCRQRFRRYLVSDRVPIIERAKDIRQHDLTEGLLKPPQWQDVRLVYLDPPYWKQAQGEYSQDATDMANMPLELFNDTLGDIITGYAKKLSARAHVALIISPTQWKAPERQFTDHVGDMLRRVKLPVDMRYSVPYESQQYNGQMVDWAKAEKRCLVLTREIVVWRVP